jgi:hypothetical protein
MKPIQVNNSWEGIDGNYKHRTGNNQGTGGKA